MKRLNCKMRLPSGLNWARNAGTCDLTLIANWVPLLKVLRILGDAPIQIIKQTQVEGINPVQAEIGPRSPKACYVIKFRWVSGGILCTLVVGILRTKFQLIQYFSTYGAQLYHFACAERNFQQTNLSQTEKLVMFWPCYIAPVMSLFEWTSLLATVNSLAKFINNWKLFGNVLGESSGCHAKQIRLIWLGFVTYLPTLSLHLGEKARSDYSEASGSKVVDWKSGLNALWGIAIQIEALTEDFKILCMCRAVSTGMAKIRGKVQESIDLNSVESLLANPVVRLTMRNCQEAHKILKEQVRLIESSQGPRELSYMCFLVMILTFQLFLTIFRGETPNTFVLFNNAAIVLASLMRFYMKCHYAEDITQQENLLAKVLFSWQLSDIPEARQFANWIKWNPTKVVYTSVFTMEKRLMLSIACQLMTNIIILLQFQLSFGTNQA